MGEKAKNKRDERIGVEKTNNEGCVMKCIEYNTAQDILVEFQDQGKAKVKTQWWDFEKGQVRNPKRRVGEIGVNKLGYEMEIVDYISCSDIYVRFKGGDTITHTNYREFKEGNVKNWDAPVIYGCGIIGNMRNKFPLFSKMKEYNTWLSMLERCYKKENLKKRPTYELCEVCEDWMYFENFYNWIHEQENCEQWLSLERSAIDKDIIIKGNKIYSPETCCLVPLKVNSLFIRQKSIRGKYPIGVFYSEKEKGFTAKISDKNSTHHLGVYATPELAFKVYKKEKEKMIKQVAQEEYYSGNITKRCYDAMMNYKVEITD